MKSKESHWTCKDRLFIDFVIPINFTTFCLLVCVQKSNGSDCSGSSGIRRRNAAAAIFLESFYTESIKDKRLSIKYYEYLALKFKILTIVLQLTISAWFSDFEIFENYTKVFLFPNSFVLIGFSKVGSLNEKKMLSLILYSRVKCISAE